MKKFAEKMKTMKSMLLGLMVLGIMIFAVDVTAYAAPARFADAEEMKLDQKYSGTMYASGSEKRYSFTITQSSRVSIYITSQNDFTKFTLHYGNGANLAQLINAERAGTGYAEEFVYYLRAGTYYMETYCNLYTTTEYSIPYTVTVSAAPSNESFVETQSSNDDSFPNANKIELNKKYYGQFGLGDSFDVFVVKVPVKGTITLDYISNKRYAAYQIYNAKQQELQDERMSETDPINDTYIFEKGTYYFVMDYGDMTGDNMDTDDWGTYNFKLTYKPTIDKAKIAKATRKKTNATVKVKRLKNVTGYEIAYSTSKRFAKSSTKYIKVKSLTKKIKKLNKKKTYYVRVRGYYTYKNKTYYGPYSAKKKLQP